MTVGIELTRNLVTLVDDEDFEWLDQWNWRAMPYRSNNHSNWYAVRTSLPDRKTVVMHRLILDAPKGVQVDHHNGDGLDNQKSNLRLATNTQNQWNRGPNRNSSSGVKGVCWDKRSGKWMATITIEGRQRTLGCFVDLDDAAEAYRLAAVEYHGEFVWEGLVKW